VAVSAPGPVDTALELPFSQTTFVVGETVYLEVWAHGGIAAPELAAVHADLIFDPTYLAAQGVAPGGPFELFSRGVINRPIGLVEAVGGCSPLDDVSFHGGCAPLDDVSFHEGDKTWTRVSTVTFHVRGSGRTQVTAGPSADDCYGVAIRDELGNLDPSQIQFGEITLELLRDGKRGRSPERR
jgi:hypothetical protein